MLARPKRSFNVLTSEKEKLNIQSKNCCKHLVQLRSLMACWTPVIPILSKQSVMPVLKIISYHVSCKTNKQADRKIRVELVYSIDKVVTMKKIPYLSVQLTQRSTISLCLLSQKAHVCQQFWTSWQSLRDTQKFNKVPVTHGLSPFHVCNLLHQHGTFFATLCENK